MFDLGWHNPVRFFCSALHVSLLREVWDLRHSQSLQPGKKTADPGNKCHCNTKGIVLMVFCEVKSETVNSKAAVALAKLQPTILTLFSILQVALYCWWKRCYMRTAPARSQCSSTLWTCWYKQKVERGQLCSTTPCWLPLVSPTSSTVSLGRSTTLCWHTKGLIHGAEKTTKTTILLGNQNSFHIDEKLLLYNNLIRNYPLKFFM